MNTPMPSSAIVKRRKRKNRAKATTSEPKNIKLDDGSAAVPEPVNPSPIGPVELKLIEEMSGKYPLLNNKELIEKFMKVQITNNQKGRIRQSIKESLVGTENVLVPDIIHNKMKAILNSSPELSESELRKIRILYNLLKTAIVKANNADMPKNKKKKKKKTDVEKIKGGDSPMKVENTGEMKATGEKTKTKIGSKSKDGGKDAKVKGPKRYVVFVGNLPLTIDKEKILNHFSEMNEQITSIRIPKPAEGKKTAIAFLELANEPSYEFALSKHHSMLGTRRINVLYTTQKNGKITKGEAKSKTAKLIALQKSGKLMGSRALAKKRSQRRLKLKKAQAKENENA